jgi:hypothetical protein
VLLLPFRKRRRPSPVLLHEPLLQIMQYAGLADTALLAKLSTHWRTAANDPRLYRDLSQGPACVLRGCTTVTQVRARLQHDRYREVQQLKLPPIRLCDRVIERLTLHCGNIKHLNLKDAVGIRTVQLQAIAAHLQGLTTLILGEPSGTFIANCMHGIH